MKTQRRKFTPEEDETLRNLVAENGPHKWDMIAILMPGRTGRQCRDRYQNYLCPGINKDMWTHEEEMLLLEKYSQYGSQWAKISKFFKGRTGTAIKNRWNYYVSRVSAKRLDERMRRGQEGKTGDPGKTLKTSSMEASPVERVFGSLNDSDKMEIAMSEFNPLFGSEKEPLFF